MFPHMNSYDADYYPELLELNQLRARLHLENGHVLTHVRSMDIKTLLQDGYFIQVRPLQDQKGNTHFETSIVYGCAKGCCYFIHADSMDVQEVRRYSDYGVFLPHAPKTFLNWKYYTLSDVEKIQTHLEDHLKEMRKKVVDRLFSEVPNDEVAGLIETILSSQINVPNDFDFSSFISQN